MIIITHIAIWVCFFLLPYIFSPQSKDLPFIINKYMLVVFIVINAFLMCFYYFNTQILIPQFLFKRKWLLYVISIIVCFVSFFYVPREITHLILGNEEETFRMEMKQRRNELAKIPSKSPASQQDSATQQDSAPHPPKHERNTFRRGNQGGGIHYFPGSYAVFILVFTVGTCISVMQQWLKAERTKKDIETEKLNTELSFLKSQVNPHFFFNTLNNIYSLAVVQSDQTAPAVMKLSSIMRYILTETQTNLVPLQNEVDFITNFIDLQLVRLTDKVQVIFNADGDIDNKQIAPLLFIPFVENAFKYGVSTKEKTAINITLVTKENNVAFTVTNTIVKADKGIIETTGIGINNVKRRLELLYPGKHTLQVSEENNQFIVHLDINLK
jgi:hypothetical protein